MGVNFENTEKMKEIRYTLKSALINLRNFQEVDSEEIEKELLNILDKMDLKVEEERKKEIEEIENMTIFQRIKKCVINTVDGTVDGINCMEETVDGTVDGINCMKELVKVNSELASSIIDLFNSLKFK